MNFKNLLLVIKDQLPIKRLIRNFLVTRNAWGLFHINSHIAQGTGKPKVSYNTKRSALKAAEAMGKKYGKHYSAYKCAHCPGFHLGKNRDNK